MTYVLELAAHTDLPVQTVLRVLLRQPTNESRLGRLEKMIERIDQRRHFERTRGIGAEIHRLEDRRGSSR